jgi:hypothetical protein
MVDVSLVAAVGLLVIATREWGLRLEHRGVVILLAHGEPLAGPLGRRLNDGTLRAVLLAVVAVVVLPQLAARLRWRPLLGFATLAALAWSVALASTDGWQRGFVDRLTGKDEYLHDVHRVHGNLLHIFAGGIQGRDGLQWATHVAGHPPGALLTFWSLDRLGLSGAGPAAAFCVLTGALAVPAVLVTVRSVAGEELARRAAPFLCSAPAAVWIAVSADAWFLCVTAWGIALLGLAAARHDALGPVQALAGGLLLGASLFLSYGVVLLAPLVVAVVVARRRVGPLLVGGGAVCVVVLAFAAGGFWWFDGLTQTQGRVAGGDAGQRPYSYFLVANLAALAIAVGPATVAGLSRLSRRSALVWLAAPALLGLVVADVTGLSRGEVERIWLPFMPWLIASCALLPRRQHRTWLAFQLLVGLTVQTLVVSLW